MPAIVDFPTVVQEALVIFGELFDTEPARRHFAEYLTGLIVAENKTVSGINREFALTTDQSCLNRWLTEVEWDVTALNDRRLAWLQQAPQTRYSGRGVIAIDNTLVTHEGKLIEDVGWFWDHADERHVIAHDYIISNYVCPSRAHYPIEWRRFKKRATCPAQDWLFRIVISASMGIDFPMTPRESTLFSRACKPISLGIVPFQVTAKTSAPQIPWCVPWFVTLQGISGGDSRLKSH
jgi:hypothetical protein